MTSGGYQRRGSTTINALVRMEDRIGLVSVKRAMSLLVKASEVTDYIKVILMLRINDFEHYLKLKKDRFNIAITYVRMNNYYLAVGIYMYFFAYKFRQLNHVSYRDRTDPFFSLRSGILDVIGSLIP